MTFVELGDQMLAAISGVFGRALKGNRAVFEDGFIGKTVSYTLALKDGHEAKVVVTFSDPSGKPIGSS